MKSPLRTEFELFNYIYNLIIMGVCLIVTFLILNAIIGILAFEWAWGKVKAIRNYDEKRDSRYPAFRRMDVKKWDKLKFYIGAVTVMPFRVIFALVIIFVTFFIVK